MKGRVTLAGLRGRPDFTALQAEPDDPPKPAPFFTLPDLEGKGVSLVLTMQTRN